MLRGMISRVSSSMKMASKSHEPVTGFLFSKQLPEESNPQPFTCSGLLTGDGKLLWKASESGWPFWFELWV